MWHFDLQSHIPSDIPGNVISQPYHNWMGWLEPPILRDAKKCGRILKEKVLPHFTVKDGNKCYRAEALIQSQCLFQTSTPSIAI